MTRWVLFDDPAAERLRPLTWLRPAADLLLGCETIFERWRRLLPHDPVDVACRPLLAALREERLDWKGAIEREMASIKLGSSSDDSDGAGTGRAGERETSSIWLSDLIVPDRSLVECLLGMSVDTAAFMGERLVAFRVGPVTSRILEKGAENGADAGSLKLALSRIAFECGRRGTRLEVMAESLQGLADLIRLQELLIRSDLFRRLEERNAGDGDEAMSGRTIDGFCYNQDQIRLGAGCRIDSGAVLDAREGPIVLESGCHVAPHTWIQGPFFAAGENRLLGGRIGGGTSLGPRCRVRGEVEASVFLGLGNKAHDGYVGHSYLGEWVNLGALTTTSDLKNNYSLISLSLPAGAEPTGLRKLGVFFGDHSKTRIGTLLSCGTILGVGTSLFGEPAVGQKRIPDFGWGVEGQEYEINKFLETAETVFGRREVAWTPAMVALLRDVHAATR